MKKLILSITITTMIGCNGLNITEYSNDIDTQKTSIALIGQWHNYDSTPVKNLGNDSLGQVLLEFANETLKYTYDFSYRGTYDTLIRKIVTGKWQMLQTESKIYKYGVLGVFAFSGTEKWYRLYIDSQKIATEQLGVTLAVNDTIDFAILDQTLQTSPRQSLYNMSFTKFYRTFN